MFNKLLRKDLRLPHFLIFDRFRLRRCVIMGFFPKLLSKPLDPKICNQYIVQALSRISESGDWEQVWLFGSAARGEMTNISDLDFVVIYPDAEKLKLGRSLFYRSQIRSLCSLDVLFVTKSEFESKSKIGGVFYVCRNDGKMLLSKGI